MNIDNLKRDISYRFLLFESSNHTGFVESQKIYKRLNDFIISLDKYNAPMKNIEIRVCNEIDFPFYSFFLFEFDEVRTSIIYLSPLTNVEGKTYGAYKTTTTKVVDNLDDEFVRRWENADIISIDKLNQLSANQ